MNRLHRTLAIFVSFAVLLVFSIQLDPLAATGMTRYASLASAARFFNFIGNGAFLIPLCLLLYILGLSLKGTDLRNAGRDALYSFALGGIAVHILKAAFERPRMAHSAGAVMKLLSNPSFFDFTGKFNSFPSGHTVAAFSVAYALSKRYPALRLLFYAVAVLVGASRVYTASHYPSDVVAGAVVGVWAGYLITCRGEVKRKWLLSGLTILIISMSFFKTGGFLLFDVDEAVFSEASREMVETGDYITPTYNYEARYDKPILFYWFMAAAFKLFGTNEFAARFTSGGFGVLLVFLTFLFIRRVRGELAAYACALVLLLNTGFFFYSHSAVTDMTLAFFITASIFSFYLAL
ncbi:MAG: phosphatase PAP2 family protein, partial [Deltaproteobacteria bacterium]|nr:phosphatase PAP2 family protein [Deltaproteobacteria bacterium]